MAIESLLPAVDFVKNYLDDVAIFTKANKHFSEGIPLAQVSKTCLSVSYPKTDVKTFSEGIPLAQLLKEMLKEEALGLWKKGVLG